MIVLPIIFIIIFSHLIAGLKLWYNFSKEHGDLGGDVTPSEAALIKADGDNKWKAIIHSASLNRDYE